MLVRDWLFCLALLMLICMCILGIYAWYKLEIEKLELILPPSLILIYLVIVIPICGYIFKNYDYADKYVYACDVNSSQGVLRDIDDGDIAPTAFVNACILSYKDLSYFGVTEKDLYGYNSFDRVCFKDKGNKLSLAQFVKGIKDKSIWLDIEIVSCTDYIKIKGSDINIVSDVRKHTDSRNRVYYDDKTYIKYKDVFYKIPIKETSWVQDVKEYVLVFDSLSKDKITNLEGTYDCYNTCEVYRYEKEE